jgi:hypothetical protein
MFGLVAYDFFLFYPEESKGEMDILDIIIGTHWGRGSLRTLRQLSFKRDQICMSKTSGQLFIKRKSLLSWPSSFPTICFLPEEEIIRGLFKKY